MSDDVKGRTVTVRFSAGELGVLEDARGSQSVGAFVKAAALAAAGDEAEPSSDAVNESLGSGVASARVAAAAPRLPRVGPSPSLERFGGSVT